MNRYVVNIGNIGILILLLLATSVVSAAENPLGALGGILKNLQGKSAAPVKQSYMADGEQSNKEHGRFDPYSLSGGVDVHSYETQLQDPDYNCEAIVDPFELEKNFSSIIMSTVKDRKAIIGMLLKPKSGKMLESAKRSAKRMNWMPLNFEIRYGEELHKKEVVADKKFISRDSRGRYRDMYKKADELLARVLASIGEQYPYEFKLFLLNSSQIQGHAAPGGYLYITTAVLENEHADFVLAHEIAHVLKRHQTRELQARIVETVDTVDDLKALSQIDNLSGEDLSQLFNKISGTYLHFSRQQELQADACSVRIAGGHSVVNLRQRIAAYARDLGQEDGSGKTDLLSIHPGYADRYKRMDTVAKLVENEQYTAGVR